MTEQQNLPRTCEKHLESSSDLPLGKNAQAIKLDSNVSCSNNLMQRPDCTGPKKETYACDVTLKIPEVATICTVTRTAVKT